MKRKIRRLLPNGLVNWFWHLPWAIWANVKYGFPARKLRVTGVTGTDGKTTTVFLIHHLLETSGRKTAMISTVENRIDINKIEQAGLHVTSPHPLVVQKFLKRAVRENCQDAVLEVSSHAIDQFRVWGIPFEVGVLTNITFEHTDYHGSFEDYKKTKIKWLRECKKKIVNLDLAGEVHDAVTFGFSKKADIHSEHIKDSFKSLALEIAYGGAKNLSVQTGLKGRFNVLNILGAVAAVKELGLSDQLIIKGLKTFKAPRGRFEIVIKMPFTVIVDFAHTPAALEAVLSDLKSLALEKAKDGAKLIHVFGATGERDSKKRPLMGRVSSQYADIIILTSEDTYKEDPSKIAEMIKKGISPGFKGQVYEELDRREAIRKAMSLAKLGDVVVLTGVGHQTTMNQGGREIPWSEVEEVREALKMFKKK